MTRLILIAILLLSVTFGDLIATRDPRTGGRDTGRSEAKKHYVPRTPTELPLPAPQKSALLNVVGFEVIIPIGQEVAKTRYDFYSSKEAWSHTNFFSNSTQLIRVLEDELKQLGYRVQQVSGLFQEPIHLEETELQIGGVIEDLRAEKIYSSDFWTGLPKLNKSRSWIKVRWKVYDPLRKTVVNEVTHEGFAEVKHGDYGPAVKLSLLSSFRNFLAHKKTVSTLRSRPKSVEPIISTKIKGVPESNRLIKEWHPQIRGAVVQIFSGAGRGSGFFISSNQGLCLTNAHVVGRDKMVEIRLITGRRLSGEVIARNFNQDVALIKSELPVPQSLPLRREAAQIGEDAYAIGAPLDSAFEATITKGVVSGYRTINSKLLIQSDAAIKQGSSGGPLLDEHGNVIGIAQSVYLRGFSDTNFFIPIDVALEALRIDR